MDSTNLFGGLPGRLTAKVMARSNRDAEQEAIEILDPTPDATVVAIGVGPGVGVELLSTRVQRTVGVDPSEVMIDLARRRCRSSVASGTSELVLTNAAALPLLDAEADGAIAVNSIQLWEPLDRSTAEVARVLRPGARLVALTHDWAIKRSTGLEPEQWVELMSSVCAAVGLVNPTTWRARAENGRSVVFVVTKLNEC